MKSSHCRYFVENHDSILSCDWLKTFFGMIKKVIEGAREGGGGGAKLLACQMAEFF